jgi:tRNA G18 (ribose-2'-O)-methylase SpoU
LVALTPASDAASLHEFASATSSADRLMLLLGAEGSGLTPAALEIADLRVRIPVDTGVDSLNVVVAASIALERLR